MKQTLGIIIIIIITGIVIVSKETGFCEAVASPPPNLHRDPALRGEIREITAPGMTAGVCLL